MDLSRFFMQLIGPSKTSHPPDDPRVRFTMQNKVGKGGHGYVYKAIDTWLSQAVAIKVLNLEDLGDEIDHVNEEISIMSALDCPQLIRYYSSHLVSSSLWIVMEYLEAGSLLEIIKDFGPLDEASIAYVMKELLLALKYLHGERKIHRDIKAANLLVSDNGSLKLADFGVTSQLTESINKRQTRIGTPYWMAPEVISQSSYDGCADIWSTGITAIELAMGVPPLSHIHPMQAIFLIPKNDSPTLEGDKFSSQFKDFVRLCLQKESVNRPSAEKLLKHPFITFASKTESFVKLAKQKCEANHLKYQSDIGHLEGKGMTRVVSNDSGFWDFNVKTPGRSSLFAIGSKSGDGFDNNKNHKPLSYAFKKTFKGKEKATNNSNVPQVKHSNREHAYSSGSEVELRVDSHEISRSSQDAISQLLNSNDSDKTNETIANIGLNYESPVSSPVRITSAKRHSRSGVLSSPLDSVIKILKQYQVVLDGNDRKTSLIFENVLLPSLQHLHQLVNNSEGKYHDIKDVSDPVLEEFSIDERNSDIRNIVTVLISTLTALDLVSNGKLSNELLSMIAASVNEVTKISEDASSK